MANLIGQFNHLKEAYKIQQEVLEMLKTGNVDNAVHIVFTEEGFKEFLAVRTKLPDAAGATKFVKCKIIEGASQQFSGDFASHVAKIMDAQKALMIKELSDYFGCATTFEGGKIVTATEVPLTTRWLPQIFLQQNKDLIDKMEAFQNTLTDSVYPYRDSLEKWFVTHVIPADDPSDKSPYIVSFFADMMPDEIPENDLDTTMAQAPSGRDVIAELVEPANPEGTDIE